MRPPSRRRGMWMSASPRWSARRFSAHVAGGGRVDQLRRPGQFVTAEIAGEPLVVVRGGDNQLRAFYNVCRHHAAAVVTEEQGTATILRCPYHGWSYGLDGSLKGTPEFEGVCGFDRAQNGLVPVRVETWEQFVFVNLDPKAAPWPISSGGLVKRVAPLNLDAAALLRAAIVQPQVQLEGVR